MNGRGSIVDLAEAGAVDRRLVGGKAGVLGELAGAGLPVPPGFVVTASALDGPDRLEVALAEAAARAGGARFAVRSSGAAEDLPDASYAGLYETYLDVPPGELADAVRRCFAAAGAERVRSYHQRHAVEGSSLDRPGMAVLVQRMVDAQSAGVAFTANPVTGDREQIVVTAVRGLGEPLVSGEALGEEWTVHTGQVIRTRSASNVDEVLDAGQTAQVAALAHGIAERYGRAQDIEWAIDTSGRLWLLQARPMTALPDPVTWAPPGPGLWMRNFRLGEWLPEAMTPLFADWLVPVIEDGYLDGMRSSVGVRVPFRYAAVNGWYYNATPVPSPRLLARVIGQGRRRAVKVLFNALIRVGHNPAAADRAVLAGLHRQWRDAQLPRYREMVTTAQAEIGEAGPQRLAAIVEKISREAGIYLWFLAIVGGSAWKMEACLTRFCRRHVPGPIEQAGGSVQVLLGGLPGTRPVTGAHAVQSVDWYHPLAGELPTAALSPDSNAAVRHRHLAELRTTAQAACQVVLVDRPKLLADFNALLEVAQRYTVIREEQARDFSLGWPVLRECAHRLGQHLITAGVITQADDVFFCTRGELDPHAVVDGGVTLVEAVARRRELWQRQRRLSAPLTLGRPPRLVGDPIAATVRAARRNQVIAEGAIVGHPASAGRATGPVRIVSSSDDFASFRDGDVLVAKATAPAWTPLFARAAAVVTDGGTLAAHASLVAREYGIPAVVATRDATSRLQTGQIVTVDGTAGTVIPLRPEPHLAEGEQTDIYCRDAQCGDKRQAT